MRKFGQRQRDPNAEMTLIEHLRELRNRLFQVVGFLVIATIVGWFLYDFTFSLLKKPIDYAIADAAAQGREIGLVLAGVADAFTLQLKVSATFALIVTAPVWLWHLWRFITPGLKQKERRYGLLFMFTALPLFFGGVWLAYTVLPIAMELLLGFTPQGVSNLLPVDRYLNFFLRTLIVFGIGFLAPVVLVMLNLANVVAGSTMLKWWRQIIMIVVVFGAVATPTGDPLNMMLLAGPMLILVFAAIGIALLVDKRRGRSEEWSDSLSDDEASPL
jgi:sec-independent protein translocase protein TatC